LVKNPYDNIPYSVNDSEEHRELSAKVARETMTLLKKIRITYYH
jgi:hypothetical protein